MRGCIIWLGTSSYKSRKKKMPVVRKISIIVCLVAISCTSEVKCAEFLEHPSSLNASEGSTAVFNCTAYSQGHLWLINDKTLTDQTNTGRGVALNNEIVDSASNLKIHLMSVPADPLNDGIKIRCLIYDLTTISSPTALLQIQGLLDAVDYVTIEQVNATTAELSFVAPTSLDNVPITNYSVEVFSGSILHSTLYSDDQYMYITDLDTCSEYDIVIAAWNGAGKGANVSTHLLLYKAPVMPPSSITRQLLTQDTIEVIIHTEVNNSCSGRAPDIISISLGPDNITCDINSSTCTNSTTILVDDTGDADINITCDIGIMKYYNASLRFINSGGVSPSSSFTFDTFQIISAEVQKFSDIYCINCTFIKRSTISGCYADFVLGNQTVRTLFVPRALGSNCINSGLTTAGTYRVYIHGDNEASIATILNVIITPSLSTITATTSIPSVTIPTSSASVLVASTTVNIKATPRPDDIHAATTSTLLITVSSAVTGVAVILLLCIVIPLVACVCRYKKIIAQLKLAESDATERQRSAEHFLYTITGSTTPSATNIMAINSPPDRSDDTMYETVAHDRIDSPNTVSMKQCPAYKPLPLTNSTLVSSP